MDNELGTSIEADKNLAALGDGWTKSLKNIPEFSYQKLEERLVLVLKKHLTTSLLKHLNIKKWIQTFQGQLSKAICGQAKCEERR